MEGDFTRNSHDEQAAYSGVLLQQGRVQLDADWNEQGAILTRALRAALRDLIGPYGGPAGNVGFAIAKGSDDATLTIQGGTYYVDGIRVVQREESTTLPLTGLKKGTYLAFLDVWERHVNALEDPRIREVALLGPDTATRCEVLSRVRMLSVASAATTDSVEKLVTAQLEARPHRRLAARAVSADANTDPCQLSPLAQFRGRENQLYRVQIHEGLPKGAGGSAEPVLLTFKWSRDNGSVVFPIVHVAGPESPLPATAGDGTIEVTVELGDLGRDERFGLVTGDIVEFVHDALGREAREDIDDAALVAGGPDPGRPGLLGRVLAPIDRDDLTVRIAVYANDVAEIVEPTLNPYLRRWDHRARSERPLVHGAVPVRQSDLDKWLPLEHGVEILFEGPSKPAQQRAGEYWQIPARTTLGDVLWSHTGSTPARLPPHGPRHHYAPLAIVHWNGSAVSSVTPARRTFTALALPE